MRKAVILCFAGLASGLVVFLMAYEVLWRLLVPDPLTGTPGVVLAVVPAVAYSLLIAAIAAILVVAYLTRRLKRSALSLPSR
jgi:hypothetical protein